MLYETFPVTGTLLVRAEFIYKFCWGQGVGSYSEKSVLIMVLMVLIDYRTSVRPFYVLSTQVQILLLPILAFWIVVSIRIKATM